MYVTLVRDIPNFGKKGERLLVSDAYARNVLIPKKMVIIGEQSLLKLAPDRHIEIEIRPEWLQKLSETQTIITSSANEQGGLYKGISEKELTDALSRVTSIPATYMALPEYIPIKKIGKHTLPLQIGKTKKTITVDIQTHHDVPKKN